MSPTLKEALFDLYKQVDREVAEAGPQCEASGRCCRFKEYGHVLFLTNLEAEVLLANAPAYEKPVSADYCPFQKENFCTAREPRPLGCRIYFCDPSYQETGNRITEKSLRRLRQLAVAYDWDYQYAPLHYFLNNASSSSSSALSPEDPALVSADSLQRTPLPLVEATSFSESED